MMVLAPALIPLVAAITGVQMPQIAPVQIMVLVVTSLVINIFQGFLICLIKIQIHEKIDKKACSQT